MPKLRNPADVQYLSFQGGGGLGFAYIGALRALEELKVLPISPTTPNQVKGISGTSAGAITALFVSLGCTSADLKDLFSQKQSFEAFYDDPRPGKCRGLTPSDHSAELSVLTEDTADELKKRIRELYQFLLTVRSSPDLASGIGFIPALWLGSPLVALVLALAIGAKVQSWASKIEAELPFMKRVFKQPGSYFYNLVYDRGIFPGLEIRTFIQSQMRTLIGRMPQWRKSPRLKDASTIDFAMLKELTGVDLVVCATCISQRRSQLFSADRTPRFPVAEAVGMSACIPILFKPILVRASQADPVLGHLRGLWVDGGVLNNIPIHAFDDLSSAPKGKGSITPLHPNMLGLRLTEGAPQSSTNYRSPEYDATPLLGLAEDLFQTLMVPGRDGQLRTPEEKEQTVDLFTYNLSVFDFSPSPSKAEGAVRDARTSVREYFGVS